MTVTEVDDLTIFFRVPRALLPKPTHVYDRFKFNFWKLYAPLHPLLRDTLLKARIITHGGRQQFLLGTVAPDKKIDSVVQHLISQGFGNHFIAWCDDGEVIGLRKADTFEFQYHVRLFNDGEVRAHYEYTPEAHPLLHLLQTGREPRRDYFLKLLENRITPLSGT